MKRRIALLVLALGFALALAATGWLSWALLRPGPGTAVEIAVEPGASASQVLALLNREGLLPSRLAGRLYLRLFGRGRSLHFGRYRLPATSNPRSVIERLLDGEVETVTVTIVEGTSAVTIGELFAAATIGTVAEWAAATADPQTIVDLAPGAPSLEGFLFPDTYRFAESTPVDQAVRHMVQKFRAVWQEESALVPAPWGTPLDVVSLASLVEAETSLAAERPLVAGVFLNRLGRGMLLQCDPTVVYGLKRNHQWDGRLLRRHWLLDDPYNTYRYPGLPPGPINSPGRAALRAALAPQETRNLYFVAKPNGGHTFSATLRDHNRAVSRLRHSRR